MTTIESEPVGSSYQAALTFDTVAGQTYYIEVGGFRVLLRSERYRVRVAEAQGELTVTIEAPVMRLAPHLPGSAGQPFHGTHSVPFHQRCHVRPSWPFAHTSIRSALHEDAAGAPASSPPSDSQSCQRMPSQ